MSERLHRPPIYTLRKESKDLPRRTQRKKRQQAWGGIGGVGGQGVCVRADNNSSSVHTYYLSFHAKKNCYPFIFSPLPSHSFSFLCLAQVNHSLLFSLPLPLKSSFSLLSLFSLQSSLFLFPSLLSLPSYSPFFFLPLFLPPSYPRRPSHARGHTHKTTCPTVFFEGLRLKTRRKVETKEDKLRTNMFGLHFTSFPPIWLKILRLRSYTCAQNGLKFKAGDAIVWFIW